MRQRDEDAAIFAGRYAGDETECRFVSTYGLMKSCTLRTEARPGKPPRRPWGMARAHASGGWIYVHPECLGGFARWGLSRIRTPFTLLSGNSVTDIRPGPLPAKLLDRIVGHPQLVHWHAQNLGMTHPKMSVLPLGLDYHTMSIGRVPFWGERAPPVAQEAELDRLRRAAPPLAEREVRGYSNWHFAPDNPYRAAARAALDDAVNVYQTDRMPRAASWEANARFLFTLSPRGRGMDCHRTWEAILLGSVPVIDDLPIAPVYAGLPVVTVRDWAEVTPDFLKAERQRILSETFDFAPLFLAYWRTRIAGRPVPALRMTYQEFLGRPADDLAAALVSQQSSA